MCWGCPALSERIRFIGDVHGHVEEYREAVRGVERSIQVGDFGLGWLPPVQVARLDRKLNGGDQRRHVFLRGNHDDPTQSRICDMCLDGWGWEGEVFYLSGASSIDQRLRTEGVDWWSDEQLSVSELIKAKGVWGEMKPRFMVSHDCPQEVARVLTHEMGRPFLLEQSRTRETLQEMWQSHAPEVWVFGHWHMSWRKQIGRTIFVCLNVMETFDLEMSE